MHFLGLLSPELGHLSENPTLLGQSIRIFFGGKLAQLAGAEI
jgi:hypothetical protein